MQAKHTENIRTVRKYHKTRIKTISYESCTRRREHRTIWNKKLALLFTKFQGAYVEPVKKNFKTSHLIP